MKKQVLSLVIVLTAILTGLTLFVPYSGYSQTDIIFKKTGGKIPCKVREITVDVIKYERADVSRGPIIEIQKQDVYKIRYKNGVVEIIDAEYIKTHKSDTTKKKTDTTDYSLIYVVYNSGQSSEVFPLVVNGKYVCRMTNHSRLVYKLWYKGEINVCRQMKKTTAPCSNFEIIPGNNYGIEINLANEYATPGNRFSMTVYDDPGTVIGFIENKFYGFKPFKANDYNFVEKKE